MEAQLQQVLSELKEIRASQAAIERTVNKSWQKLVDMQIAQVTYDGNMALIEQGMKRANEKLEQLLHLGDGSLPSTS